MGGVLGIASPPDDDARSSSSSSVVEYLEYFNFSSNKIVLRLAMTLLAAAAATAVDVVVVPWGADSPRLNVFLLSFTTGVTFVLDSSPAADGKLLGVSGLLLKEVGDAETDAVVLLPAAFVAAADGDPSPVAAFLKVLECCLLHVRIGGAYV